MKKIIWIVVWFYVAVVTSASAESFYIAEGTLLRNNVDATLMNYQGDKARVMDSRGVVYRMRLNGWSGNCRQAVVYAPNGDTAQTSICVRKQQISQAQVQAVQYQSAMRDKQTHLARAQYNVGQQSNGWFASKPGLQFGLRGNPDSPFQAVQTQYVPLNTIQGMSDAEFERFKYRTDWATSSYIPQTIQNSGAAAESATRWTSGNYNNSYQQRAIPDAVNQGFANIISRALNNIF